MCKLEERVRHAIEAIGEASEVILMQPSQANKNLAEQLEQAVAMLREFSGASSEIATAKGQVKAVDEGVELFTMVLEGLQEESGEHIRQRIYGAINFTNRWDLATAFDDYSTRRLGTLPIQTSWLQEIEASAMALLEFAPEAWIDESTGQNIVAEEAARIFSRVRMTLGEKYRAQSPAEAGSLGDDREDIDTSDNETSSGEAAQ